MSSKNCTYCGRALLSVDQLKQLDRLFAERKESPVHGMLRALGKKLYDPNGTYRRMPVALAQAWVSKDHVIPRNPSDPAAPKGTDAPENLVASCMVCNISKGNRPEPNSERFYNEHSDRLVSEIRELLQSPPSDRVVDQLENEVVELLKGEGAPTSPDFKAWQEGFGEDRSRASNTTEVEAYEDRVARSSASRTSSSTSNGSWWISKRFNDSLSQGERRWFGPFQDQEVAERFQFNTSGGQADSGSVQLRFLTPEEKLELEKKIKMIGPQNCSFWTIDEETGRWRPCLYPEWSPTYQALKSGSGFPGEQLYRIWQRKEQE